MWTIILKLLLQIAIGLLLASLAPDPDFEDPPAAKLEDFNFPTADNARPIQVVYGTSIVQGPNVVWYGDYSVHPVEKTEVIEYLGIRIKEIKTIIAYNYRVGLQMALGNGEMRLMKIIAGEDVVVYDGGITSGDITIDKPRIFNSSPDQPANGLGGTVTFYPGDTTQLEDAYLSANVPGNSSIPAVVSGTYTPSDGGVVDSGISTGQTHFALTGVDDVELTIKRGNVLVMNTGDELVVTEDTESYPIYLFGPIMNLEIEPSPAYIPSGSYITDIINPENPVNDPGNVPAYRGLSYVVFKDFWVGNSPSVTAFKFEMERFYKPSWASGGSSILDDANPAWIVYDILTNKSYGAGIDPADIDEDNFQTAADVLAIGGVGLSLTFDSSISVEKFLAEISKYIDGDVIYNKVTNKFQIILSRNDYVAENLPLFDKSNVKDIKFNRPSIYESVSEVKIQFSNRAKLYKDSIAQFQDLGLRYNKNSADSTIRSYPWVKEASLANKLAARDIRPVATSLAQVEITTNTDSFDLNVGDVVRLTWEPYNIFDMVVRITSINFGLFDKNSIKITAIQDKFGVTETSYEPPADTGWSPIDTSLTSTTFNAIETPYYFNNSDLFNKVMMWAKDPENGAMSYEMWTENASNVYQKNNSSSSSIGFAPEGTLLGANDANSVEFTVISAGGMGNISNKTESEIQLGSNIAYIKDGSTEEFIGFTTIVDNGDTSYTISGVKRGLFDTTPKKLIGNEPISFFSEGFAIGSLNHVDAELVGNKCLPVSSQDILDIGDSPVVNVTINERSANPLRPTDVKAWGLPFPDATDLPVTGFIVALDLEWKHRLKENEVIVRFYDDDTDANIESDTEYLIEYFNDSLVLVYSTVVETTNDKGNVAFKPGAASGQFGGSAGSAIDTFVGLTIDDFGVDIDLSYLALNEPSFSVEHPTLGTMTEGVDYTVIRNAPLNWISGINLVLGGSISIGDTIEIIYEAYNLAQNDATYEITARDKTSGKLSDVTNHTIT